MATVMQINVIDASAPQTVKTAKGSYQFIEVAYKRDGKVEGKKVMDFGHNAAKDVFSFLKQVSAGDILDVTLEKVNDYWTWVGVKKASESTGDAMASPTAQQAASPNSAKASGTGRVVGSNYETPEERAVRQRLIVRQSSLTAALTLLTHNLPKGQFATNELFKTAEEITDWVFEKKSGVQGLTAMADDIPL